MSAVQAFLFKFAEPPYKSPQHCLANYFLTIPASTGHSLCKPGAAAAAAAVYGVVALIAKQTLFFMVVFSKRRQRQKELVQVPPLTGLKPNPYVPYPALTPVAELASPLSPTPVYTRDFGTRDFGQGMMQTYNPLPITSILDA